MGNACEKQNSFPATSPPHESAICDKKYGAWDGLLALMGDYVS